MFTPGDSRLTDIIGSNDGHRCNREVPRGPRYSPDFIPSFRESGRSRIPAGDLLAVESMLSSVSSRESTDPDSRNRATHQVDQIIISGLLWIPFLRPYSLGVFPNIKDLCIVYRVCITNLLKRT